MNPPRTCWLVQMFEVRVFDLTEPEFVVELAGCR